MRNCFPGRVTKWRRFRTSPGRAFYWSDFNPDLVILDADIPAGGGEKVFDIIRRILRFRVWVIFITGLPERVRQYNLPYYRVKIFEKSVESRVLLDCVSDFSTAA